MGTVRDHLWMWGHDAGSHNTRWGLPGASRMTPAEGAYYLGVPNLMMVAFGGIPEPPFEQYARSLRPLDRVVWSIVGDSSSVRNDDRTDLDEVLALTATNPNLTGVIMDDFFVASGEHGARAGRYTAGELAQFRTRLGSGPRPLDMWVVVYTHDLADAVRDCLDQCDVIAFWTWHGQDIGKLEANFARLRELAPDTRTVLGCYMWDYGNSCEMPVERMQYQCEKGLEWLMAGKIEGMIFLASCICDLGIPAVEWTRDWIAANAATPLPT